MRVFLHRPQSVFLRRALFQIHLWTGIAVGLYVFVVCVTGSALVFRIEMQKAEYPHLFTPSAGGPLAGPGAIMTSVQAAFPDGRLSGVDAPTTVRPTYLAYVSKGSDFLTVLVDPVSARVLGLLPDRSWVRTLQDLHFDLLAGRTGRVVNGVGSLLLLAMCVTGLVIWWPGLAQWPRSLTIDFRRSWKRINWDMHSAVGLWTLAFTAMWAVTGANFTFGREIRTMVNWLSPISTVSAPKSDLAGTRAEGPTWSALIEKAQALVPGQHVARVVTPFSDSAAFLVMFSTEAPTPVGSADLTSVYLDRYTGAVLHEPPHGPRSAGDIVMAWMSPLHVGNFGGAGVRLAWVILGLAPPLLFVTGFVMWWVRVVRPQRVWITRALALGAIAAMGVRTSAQYQWDLPPRVAAPIVPADAPMTPARIELGRRLFYDKRLSGNATQSCSTCHIQAKAFTDGRAHSIGSTGAAHPRSPMSLVNVAYRDALTWANPTQRNLDEQALVPLLGESPVELGIKGHELRVYGAFERDPLYRKLFSGAFPDQKAPVTTANIAAALAAFERSIVSFRSPFDRYRQNEERNALSESALRGSVLFFSDRKARCGNCHRGLNLDGGSKTVDSPPREELVFQFHNTGLYNLAGLLSYPADNLGLFEQTRNATDVGKFRIPTLRNIALTAPYMHDGSLATLDEVLDHYVAGGRTANPNKTSALRPIALTADERQDLLAFLDSLTDREALTDPRWSDPWQPAPK